MRVIKPEQIFGERRCCVTGRTQDPDGFIDTGVVLNGWDQKVSISFAGAREIARTLGWVPPGEFKVLKDRVAALEAEYADLRELDEDVKEHRELEIKIADKLGVKSEVGA